MQITAIRTHILSAALSQPFAYSRAWYDTRTAMLLEIETDDGLIGWGECYGPAAITAAAVKSRAGALIGEDPRRTDFLWRKIYANFRDHGQKGGARLQVLVKRAILFVGGPRMGCVLSNQFI
jgi:D-galactarolactone cycloisomerase